MDKISETQPGFAVSAALYAKSDYLTVDMPLFTDMKFGLFGHDAVVFHSYAIRQRLGPFIKIKHEPDFESRLMAALGDFFRKSKATLILAVVNKKKHREKYRYPDDPYSLAVRFCLERMFDELVSRGATSATTHCVFESRGKKEDSMVREWCTEICGGKNYRSKTFNFGFSFAEKQQNMTGLQVADLTAFPAARFAESLNEDRKDWQAIRHLIRRGPNGEILGYGLKCFP